MPRILDYLKRVFGPVEDPHIHEADIGLPRPYQFKVLRDFEVTLKGHQNIYQQGHVYTVRLGEPWDELHHLMVRWVKDGKIIIV